MAKRTAESQKTKDDNESDGEESVDTGVRDTPLAPVEGRKIRGLPKRGGMGGGAPVAPPAPQPSFSAPTAAAPSTNTPFSGFAFGSSNAFAPAPVASLGAKSSSPFAAPSQPSETAKAPENPPAASPFGGFSFGKPAAPPPAASSSPFSFGTPASGSAPASSNGNMSTTTEKANEDGPAAPKPFAGFSFGGSAPSSSEQKQSEPVSFGSSTPTQSHSVTEEPPGSTPTNGPAPSLPTPPPEGEVSFYTTIRGLNTAILSFLSSTLNADPFVDLSNVLPSLANQYRKHLDVAIGSGWRPESSSPKPSEPSKAANGSAPLSAPSMPSVGSFSLPKPPTASGSTAGVGFTPTVSSSSSSSPFTFPAFVPPTPKAAPTPAATPKKPSAEVSKIVEDVIADKQDDAPEEKPASKPFTFGAAPSSQEPAKSGSLFSFAPSGPLHPSTPGSESFTPSKNIESPFAPSPAKLGKFGPGGSQPQLSFGGASASPSTPGPSKPVGFAFGSSPSASGGFNIGSGSGPPAVSGASSSFSFGGKPAAPAASSSFSFGSAPASGATSTAPSTGFSFGAKPSFGFGTTPAAPPGGVKPNFTFGNTSNSSSALATPETGSAAPSETNSEVALGDDAASSKNLADVVGAGEEGEETVSERRTRLHQLVNGKFEVKGLGVVRLKRSEGEGKKKRRLLMRSDGGGAILLNMTINDKFDPSVDGTMVKFLGFDLNGKPVVYGMRVKTKEMADEFLAELKKEVDAIKGE